MLIWTVSIFKLIEAPSKEKPILPWVLNDRFNQGRYWERALAGEFLCRVDPPVLRRPITDRPDETPGSVSIMASFYEQVNQHSARFVFRVDIVMRPDHSLGGYDAIHHGIGRPDAKKLVEDGVTYSFRLPFPAELAARDRALRARESQKR